MIQREQHDDVTILRLEHGPANALDTELMAELTAHLDELEQSSTTAIVVTGTGKMFSAGVDLYRLLEADVAYTAEFVASLCSGLRRFFASPLPTVAAINGHAIAGGCVLAAACDHRIATDGGAYLGLTELAVGVPFPAAALEIVGALLPRPQLASLVFAADKLTARQALDLGLVDALAPADEVLTRAVAEAQRLGSIPRPAFALTKRQLRQPVLDRIDCQAAAFDPEVITTWQSDAARASIRAFLDRTIGKR